MNAPLSRSLAVSIALLSGFCGACASTPASFGATQQRATTHIQVTNDQLVDMRVYAVRGGSRIRIGVVESLSTRSFKLPEYLAIETHPLTLYAEGLASRSRVRLDPLLVQPGERVDVTLGYRPWMSTASVWRR